MVVPPPPRPVVARCQSRPPAGLRHPYSPATPTREESEWVCACELHSRRHIGARCPAAVQKLMERSGMKRESRAHEHYEKPCDLRRRKISGKEAGDRQGGRQAEARPVTGR